MFYLVLLFYLCKQRQNNVPDLLEKGHIHYEMNDYVFNNASFNNGEFVVELENRKVKEVTTERYNRQEYIEELMHQPKTRFQRFLTRYAA